MDRGARPEVTTADPDDDQHFDGLPKTIGRGLNAREFCFVVVSRQGHPPVVVGTLALVALKQLPVGKFREGSEFREFAGVEKRR